MVVSPAETNRCRLRYFFGVILQIAAILMVSSAVPFSLCRAQTGEVQHFAVRQARQLDLGTPTVRAYLDLLDTAGSPMDELPEPDISATLGQWPANLTALQPFDSRQQGVGYVFLVDVSKSLSAPLFRQVVEGLGAWINDLGPKDRAAIIAFGDRSRLVSDFSNDSEGLSDALGELAPTDNQTVLHSALIDALELSRRLDSDLPGRRAIVIFSDGKDEGSSLVADDVLVEFRKDPVPIYALGFSRLRNPEERRRYLSLLDRFATNSGGASFEVRETRFSEAYQAIRRSIAGVWVADFGCPQCRPDGNVHRLQVQVNLGGRVMADGAPVRLLPIVEASDQRAAAPSEADRAKVETEEVPTVVSPEVGDSADNTAATSGGSKRWVYRVAVLTLVVAALVYRRSVINRRKAEAAARLAAGHGLHPVAPLDPEVPHPAPRIEPDSHTLPASVSANDRSARAKAPARKRSGKATDLAELRKPTASKAVRLIVIRGSRQGRQYNLMIKGRGVVGSRSDCDCVLIDETDIEPQQFELYFDGIKVLIRNLSETHPTLINGQTITGRTEISSNTLIGTDATILRLVYE